MAERSEHDSHTSMGTSRLAGGASTLLIYTPNRTGLQPEESTRSPEAHIYLYTAPRRSKCLRRRRAGLMAIRAVYGGSGRIRTHGSVTSQMISSQRRYAHFGTLPSGGALRPHI